MSSQIHTPPAPATEDDVDEANYDVLRPKEGWHVVHLFYTIDHTQWQLLDSDEQLDAKTDLTSLIQEIRSTPETQLLIFSMVSPKSDIGFMLLTPDLHVANAFEKRLTLSLGPDILTPAFSYLSLTETSEYTTTDEEYGKTLVDEEGMTEGSDEYKAKIEEFNARIRKYTHDRLYPNMPDWPVFCFYSMGKRRGEVNNWYGLDFETRRNLMKGHAAVGRRWAGKIRQLITGSVGLDESEWGVTLFAKDTHDIKNIVYEMRFDEVTVKYGEFGDFYIGIQLPLNELFQRLAL